MTDVEKHTIRNFEDYLYIVLIRDEKGILTGFGPSKTVADEITRTNEVHEFDTYEEAKEHIKQCPCGFEYIIFKKYD
jgi:hypothetical protein